MNRLRTPTALDRIGLLVVLAIAAVLRLPGIEARGRFDADQGHDMLTLLALVRDGVIPLLGPKTSVGEFHHGVFYYYLLAPAAAISNADPVVVTIWLALMGIAAVALTWWLARAIGGPLAGFLAGLLLAVSPAAIDESTFIWNPNPIALFSVLSLSAAWRAHTTGRARWWALSLASAGMVTQLHVLGVVFLIAMVAIALLELRRDRGTTPGAWRGVAGGLALVALLFVPLAIHELTNDFSEVRAMLAYLGAESGAAGSGPASALAFTLLRVVGWPLVGLVTDVPAAVALILAGLVGVVAWRLLTAKGEQRIALAWLVGILVWSTVALAFAAPSLQQVVAGLPNDHYHAFLDPIVIILLAVSAVGLLERAIDAWRSTREAGALLGGAAVGAGLGLVLAFAVIRRPPAIDPDGGWPAARAAGERIFAHVGAEPFLIAGLPEFKLPDGVVFPIVHAGGRLRDDSSRFARPIVVACDRLFEAAIGRPCGGPAEDRQVIGSAATVAESGLRLVDRFDASRRTAISIYEELPQ